MPNAASFNIAASVPDLSEDLASDPRSISFVRRTHDEQGNALAGVQRWHVSATVAVVAGGAQTAVGTPEFQVAGLPGAVLTVQEKNQLGALLEKLFNAAAAYSEQSAKVR